MADCNKSVRLLPNSNFTPLCHLIKYLSTNSNAAIVNSSTKCISALAKGLRKPLRTYCKAEFISIVFTKLRDKKTSSEGMTALENIMR